MQQRARTAAQVSAVSVVSVMATAKAEEMEVEVGRSLKKAHVVPCSLCTCC